MSLRKRINEKCKDCMYDSLAVGTWRQQVSLCSVNLCPLWSIRPQPIQCTSKPKRADGCTDLTQSEVLERQSSLSVP